MKSLEIIFLFKILLLYLLYILMETNNTETILINQYNYLMETYINTIIQLIDTSYSMKILPLKVMFGLSWIKNYIQTNRFEVLENGINYLLANKDIILNFDIEKLDELDEDFDDNVSIKSCISNIKQNHKNISNKPDIITNSDEMLNLMIDIKNNTKKLCVEDIIIIKSYFELLIIILEKIQNMFK
jgi:hypothetical protein